MRLRLVIFRQWLEAVFPNRFSQALRTPFLRNLGAMGSAEMVSRSTRLLAAIVLARMLDPIEFGIAAAAITLSELFRIFTQNGLGQAIIRADDTELYAICRSAKRLFWSISLFLTFAQAASGVIWWLAFGGTQALCMMIIALSIIYLVMPFGLTHVFLIMRANQMGRIARIRGTQASIDNLGSAVFAIIGFGPWAVILPKILSAPIWVWMVRRGTVLPQKCERKAGGPVQLKNLVSFGLPVLGAEMLTSARLFGDKLIIWFLFGLEALGIWWFAFNAGFGFALSACQAFTHTLYPHLCRYKEIAQRGRIFRQLIHASGLWVMLAILMQSLLSLIYVPIVFGEKWAAYAPLVCVLCLAALPKLLSDSASQLARANGWARTDFLTNISLTLSIFLGLVFGASSGNLQFAALGYCLAALATQPLYAFFISKPERHRDPAALYL